MIEMIKTMISPGAIVGLEELVTLLGTSIELDCVTTFVSRCRDVQQYLRSMGELPCKDRRRSTNRARREAISGGS